jgi:LacI family transcriptional regulator
MKSAFKVAVMLPRIGYGQDQLLLGIYRYARPLKPWDFLTLNMDLPAYENARNWKPDGIIGFALRKELAQAAKAIGVPFINIYGSSPFCKLPQIGYNDRSMGNLAAAHFLMNGFEHFAYFGLPSDPGSQSRGKSFVEALGKYGTSVDFFDPGKIYPEVKIEGTLIYEEDSKLHGWLSTLSRPVAIFCCDDLRAMMVSDACRHLNYHVPDEVAILGVGDHHLTCFESFPPLSSIRTPLEKAGYIAAEMLEQLIRGKALKQSTVYLEPEGIAIRQSTDTMAIQDRKVAAAVRYIRENAHSQICVADVAKFAGMNRRYLERRFHHFLNRSPFQEIRRVQIDRAQTLLRETNQTVEAIAEQTGFSSRTRLAVEFSKKTGQPPASYRKQFRVR